MTLAPKPTTGARPPRTLEDPSGRRLRRMRWLGRAIAVLFLLWVGAILLGALGVGPTGQVFFGGALQPSSGPPPLARVPVPLKPAAADLVPALPATAAPATLVHHPPAAVTLPKTRTRRGHSVAAPGHLRRTTIPAVVHGHSSTAPGHTRTTTPAAAVATPHGRSATAPGHAATTTTAKTTTTRGRSSTAAGHLVTHSAHGAVAPGQLRRTATTTAATATVATTTTTATAKTH